MKINFPKKTKKLKKPKEIIVKKKFTDEEMEKYEGEYFQEKDFNKIIKSDADIYYINPKNKKVLLAKFRKSVIPKEFNDIAIKNLKSVAKREHDNRGPAAGNINYNKLPVILILKNSINQAKVLLKVIIIKLENLSNKI